MARCPHGIYASARPNTAPPSGVSDDFNRADGSDLGADWVEAYGDWSIAANKLVTPVMTTSQLIHNTPRPSLDHWVQATIDSAAGSVGVIARRSDMNNFYYWRWRSGGGYQLYKRVGGTYSQIGGTVASGSSPVSMRLEVQGTTLRGYVDDVLVITETDASVPAGYGVGLRTGTTTSITVDNFSAGDL